MPNRRQKLVDALRVRFEAITPANDYETEVGNSVHEWRSEKLSEDDDALMPALLFRDDLVETPLPDKNTGSWKHLLRVTVDIVIGEDAEQATEARKALADVVKAIGVDPLWKDPDGNELAERTIPGDERIMTDKEGNWLGGARLEFTIEYFTVPWSAE